MFYSCIGLAISISNHLVYKVNSLTCVVVYGRTVTNPYHTFWDTDKSFIHRIRLPSSTHDKIVPRLNHTHNTIFYNNCQIRIWNRETSNRNFITIRALFAVFKNRIFETRRPPFASNQSSMQHRQPPPPPTTSKKPRFPDPVSIRPASHYPAEQSVPESIPPSNLAHSYSENNNLYSCTYPPDISPPHMIQERHDNNKRLSVISDITAEGLAKKKSKQADINKKRKGCKIQWVCDGGFR